MSFAFPSVELVKHTNTDTMESNSGDWSKSEIEQIVLWLEDPIKLRRTQKGSGETKKHWISLIASTIPSRSEAQVGYKYDNLKKSYREALRLADQSGWGLGEEDLINGNTLSLRGKWKPNLCLWVLSFGNYR